VRRLADKRQTAARRAARVRSVVRGRSDRPRLSVRISNLHVEAQLIDDQKQVTLAHVTSVGASKVGSLTDKATLVGTEIAKKAIKAGVKQVSLDRGKHLYHGRVKALADAARAGGLEF